jgi:hypothetical protein
MICLRGLKHRGAPNGPRRVDGPRAPEVGLESILFMTTTFTSRLVMS